MYENLTLWEYAELPLEQQRQVPAEIGSKLYRVLMRLPVEEVKAFPKRAASILLGADMAQSVITRHPELLNAPDTDNQDPLMEE